MIRSNLRKIIFKILSKNFFNNYFLKSTSIGVNFWKLKRFLIKIPWWNENVCNWMDLFLIFFKIKRKSDIYF